MGELNSKQMKILKSVSSAQSNLMDASTDWFDAFRQEMKACPKCESYFGACYHAFTELTEAINKVNSVVSRLSYANREGTRATD